MDKNCIGCSGNSSVILKQLKVACLSYINSEVRYKKESRTFSELNQLRGHLVQQCKRQVKQIKENHESIFGIDEDMYPSDLHPTFI